ncbi:MAG: DUF2076 family protein [Ramlibacter sp.]|jgi:hypothetical protein|uniref:DUF2076 family protein n=1 Tax=Ramlibacter sp. TaxID=1917967 RepID=UPI002632AD34|nr:DUF2076 family protein [Ramlibacter sp.]MDH4374903.1 DUF2076 family protein [Ramlibacter sp.]
MNRHERDELLQFLQPLLRARAADKDFAAETLILEQCARQPDALYLLVQRTMALEKALQAAQAQLAEERGPVDASVMAQDPDGDAPLARQQSADRSGAWGRGLLAQVTTIGAGVGLGVTAGVVAGGLLLDAAEDWFSDEL